MLQRILRNRIPAHSPPPLTHTYTHAAPDIADVNTGTRVVSKDPAATDISTMETSRRKTAEEFDRLGYCGRCILPFKISAGKTGTGYLSLRDRVDRNLIGTELDLVEMNRVDISGLESVTSTRTVYLTPHFHCLNLVEVIIPRRIKISSFPLRRYAYVQFPPSGYASNFKGERRLERSSPSFRQIHWQLIKSLPDSHQLVAPFTVPMLAVLRFHSHWPLPSPLVALLARLISLKIAQSPKFPTLVYCRPGGPSLSNNLARPISRSTLASRQGEPGSIPGWVTGYSQVGIVPDDTVGRRVFSGISHFPRAFIPSPLNTHFNHPHRLSRLHMLRAAEISSLTINPMSRSRALIIARLSIKRSFITCRVLITTTLTFSTCSRGTGQSERCRPATLDKTLEDTRAPPGLGVVMLTLRAAATNVVVPQASSGVVPSRAAITADTQRNIQRKKLWMSIRGISAHTASANAQSSSVTAASITRQASSRPTIEHTWAGGIVKAQSKTAA
ncbi:hypothetical protein PR048_021197 [Dryococelus australis]|uniref:Uncharacterized protein n=1 Tax=Dryococelus australis TaxID=614101 RepID=A0ABQ9GXJ1_9NEOP|nr:hypothetical protein PR048_021197 [Dryococelus australis]